MKVSDIEYPIRLCVKMFYYCIWNDKTKNMTGQQIKEKLSVFFTDEQLNESILILRNGVEI